MNKDERTSMQGYNRTCKLRSKGNKRLKNEKIIKHDIRDQDKQLKKRWQV